MHQMKNIYLLLAIIVSSSSVFGQDNMVTIIKALNEQPELVKGVNSITESVYNSYSYTKEIADTTIIIDGTPQELFVEERSTTVFDSPLDLIVKQYDADGKHVLTTKFSYNENGKIVSSTDEFQDPNTAAMMNAIKEFKYNSDGQIVEVFNNGFSAFKVKFHQANVIEEFEMDAGMMKMSTKMEKIDELMRYELKMIMGEEFAKMMGDKKSPREYMDLSIEGENYRYRNYKEDKETGEMILNGDYLYDSELNVLEEQVTEYGTTQHNTYEYKDGKILKMMDMTTEEFSVWKYDKNGRLQEEPHGINTKYYTYDEKGNSTIEMIKSEEGLIQLIMRTYEYSN